MSKHGQHMMPKNLMKMPKAMAYGMAAPKPKPKKAKSAKRKK